MPMNSLEDVFQHGLGDIYDAEQKLLSALDQMEQETQIDEVRERIRQHRSETQDHIRNLKQCFDLLGMQKPNVECATVRGLQQEKSDFERMSPSPQAREVFNLDAADKSEHYEIAAYRALIDQARVLGNDDVRDLLEQNLRQEEAMSQWIQDHQPRILREML